MKPIRCSLHYWYLIVLYTDGSPSVIALLHFQRPPANSSQPLADDDFDRPMLLRVTFIEPAQVWSIDPSLLSVRVCRTIYQFICVILN